MESTIRLLSYQRSWFLQHGSRAVSIIPHWSFRSLTRPPTRPHGPIAQSNASRRGYSSAANTTVPPSKQKYVPTSGTYPKGFSISGIHVGVKPSNTSAPDLALITSDPPCSAAAVFTTNKFQAAPVIVSKDVLEARGGEGIHGIVINAGCANAVTGQGGLEDARKMASTVDEYIGGERVPSSRSTLVMSTGVIGQRLPIGKILHGIPRAVKQRASTHQAWLDGARAICTTDTFPKLLSTTFSLPSQPGISYSLAGMCKGAGMIHPNMATLLGIMCTDAPLSAPDLKPLLTYAAARSFNSISIDGDTSTNDTLAILANGAAGGPPITPKGADYDHLRSTLTKFAQKLSQLVVRDGEGATKFVQVRVINAASYDAARRVASAIATSPLVKTALYGRDANWGRILCAVGYAEGVPNEAVVPEQTSVRFVPLDGGMALDLLVKGEPEAVDEVRAKQILEAEDLDIEVDLGTGTEEASYWFCDLSHEYVTINGDYRT